MCLSAVARAEAGSNVHVLPCRDDEKEEWSHTKGGLIKHKSSGLCIDISGVKSGDIVKLQKCNAGIPEQLWTFANYLST